MGMGLKVFLREKGPMFQKKEGNKKVLSQFLILVECIIHFYLQFRGEH